MQDTGNQLRRAREEIGLSLEELSSRTLIAKKYLSALEEGRTDLFPGEVYFKGALRKYAEEVGLNVDSLMAGLSAEKPVEEKRKAAEVLVKPKEKVKAAAAPSAVRVVRPRRRVNKGRLTMMVLILALLTAGIYTISNMRSPGTPNLPEPPPLAGEENPPLQPPPGEEPPAPEPPPVPPVRVVAEGENRYVVYNAEQLEIELSFNERSWVRVHTDGSQLFEDTLSPAQPRSFSAAQNVRIRTGNAFGTKVVVNGETIELPQARAPVTVEITAAEDVDRDLTVN